jgi:hypothetical protein
MVGNVHEWTADPKGTFRGGYYLDTHINGDGCDYRTVAHEATYHRLLDRLRCCADFAITRAIEPSRHAPRRLAVLRPTRDRWRHLGENSQGGAGEAENSGFLKKNLSFSVLPVEKSPADRHARAGQIEQGVGHAGTRVFTNDVLQRDKTLTLARVARRPHPLCPRA